MLQFEQFQLKLILTFYKTALREQCGAKVCVKSANQLPVTTLSGDTVAVVYNIFAFYIFVRDVNLRLKCEHCSVQCNEISDVHSKSLTLVYSFLKNKNSLYKHSLEGNDVAQRFVFGE